MIMKSLYAQLMLFLVCHGTILYTTLITPFADGNLRCCGHHIGNINMGDLFTS